MLRSISIFAVMAICLGIPCIGRADEPQTPDPADVRARMQILKGHSYHLEQELEDAEKRLNDIQQDIRGATGLVEVDPEMVRRLITTLQEQREQLELEAAGADGRRAALEDAVARLSKQVDDRAASDQVSIELAKVADIRQAELKRLEKAHANGIATQSDLEAAQAALASARAELAAARQKAVSSASGDALDTWNRQLLELTIAQQERTARFKFVNEKLAKLSGILGGLDAVDSARAEVIRLQQQDLGAKARLEHLSVEAEMEQLKTAEEKLRAEKAATTQPAGGAGAKQENR